MKKKNKATLESNKVTPEVPSIPFYKLFQYSTPLDKILIILAVTSGLVAGISMPIFYLMLGKSAGFLVDYWYVVGSNGTNPKLIGEAGKILEINMIWFVELSCALGIVLFISTYLTTVLLNYTALKQTFKIRELFFASVLHQDISWYDQNKTGNFSSRMVDDLKKIEEGLGEKFGMIIYYQSICVASLIQALVQGWELALICMVTVPVAIITIGIVSWISSKFAKEEIAAYAEAGSVAEEVLSSIKTVVAFGGQAKEEERYNSFLAFAKSNNIKRALFNGISVGVNWFFTYCSFGLAFWYGVKLVIRESNYPIDQITYDASTMVTVFVSILCAQMHLGMVSPYIETIGIAQGAAAKVFAIISSQPLINQSKGKGQKIERVQGKISFKDIYFRYPSRKDVEVLRGLNLTIQPGETVALVGSSGCGKSTCIQLIQRFYDADSGSVSIDDQNITDLDLDCLRSYIGVVGQEPVLFETTIAENIRYGLLSATQDQIEKAARNANAHTFISALPQGYLTMIGERGAQLSGGQKQRIAIARALIRNPAILLLDEATSALDTKSESIVQAALDTASYGCTTVIVAHRLSTVRKADRIFVISKGEVKEEGCHGDLMRAKGEYYQLIRTQVTDSEESDSSVKIEEIELENIDEPKNEKNEAEQNDVIVDKIEKSSTNSSLWAIMKYNSPEWWFILIGSFCCMINGASMPLYSIFFGKIVGILSNQDEEEIQREMNLYCISFVVIAVGVAIATIIQFYSLGVAGENLTMRLRSLMFKAMLIQEIGWFDDKKNGVGSLCARLSGEPESVQGATGQRIGTLLNSGTTVIMAVTLSLYYDWKIALVGLGFAPLLVISSYMEQKILVNESHDYYEALENSSKVQWR